MSWGIGDRVGVAVSAGTIATFNSRRKSPVPSLVLDFAGTGTLDPRVTFTRSTTGVYYNGTTTALAEQNLLLNSNSFGTTWVRSNLGTSGTAPTIATTTGTLPDGSTGTIYQLTFPALTAGQASAIYQSINTLHGLTAWSGSVYAQIASGTATIYTVLEDSLAGPSSGNYVTATQLLTTSWQRLVVSGSYTSGSGNAVLMVGFDGRITGQTNLTSLTVNLAFAQLEQRASPTAYNATTTAIVQNYIPQLLTAAINAPRFDYNPVTSTALGLLIEQSSTNLLTYSQDFSNAVWPKSNATITPNADIAPDGTQTVSKLVESTANAEHYVAYNNASLASGVRNTVSLYSKAAERSYVTWYIATKDAVSIRVRFNLTNGTNTIIQTGANLTVNTSVDAGNGWWKLSLTFDGGTGATTPVIVFETDNGSTFSYTGNGYSGIYIWGAQLEALPFATSYIATTSAQVTRGSDNASMTGTNFSSWYNATQGTLYAETIPRTSSSSFQGITSLSTGTSSQANEVVLGFTYPSVFWSVDSNGSNQGNSSIGTAVQNSPSKIAISFVQNSILVNVNGVSTATGSPTAKVPLNITTLTIGYDPLQINPRFLVGTIKKISFYPIALNASQLVTLNTP